MVGVSSRGGVEGVSICYFTIIRCGPFCSFLLLVGGGQEGIVHTRTSLCVSSPSLRGNQRSLAEGKSNWSGRGFPFLLLVGGGQEGIAQLSNPSAISPPIAPPVYVSFLPPYGGGSGRGFFSHCKDTTKGTKKTVTQ